jgi:mRNA interferase MazF
LEGVKRGDIVTVALSGDYGKPRPALIIQADAFQALPSITLLRLTSEIIPAHLARITVEPCADNGLRLPSQIMVDKAIAVPREKIGQVIGRLDTATMRSVNKALVAFFDLEGSMA